MGKNKTRKLYSHSLSGNSYKVRLFMELLNLEYDEIPVDIPQGEHKSADFLAINPLGQVPVLSEGEVTIRDSQAILVYLDRKYGGEEWLPVEPVAMAEVMQWLSFAANEIHHSLNLARLHFLLGVEVDLKLAQERSHAILKIMNEHLANCDWLELARPTIADLACFPYVALSSEGGVPLEGNPNVKSWIDRVKGLPNYVSMPGL